MIGELLERNKNEENKKYSIIHWQIGEPKEYGKYLVQYDNGMIDSLWFIQDLGRFLNKRDDIEIVCWCKLSDIKPYKEEKK